MSLITDQVQGVLVLVLVVILFIAVIAYVPAPEPSLADSGAADATEGGVRAAIILIIAVTAANMFHSGYWQRIWAAANNAVVVRAVAGASVVQIIVVVLVGVLGMLALAVYGSALFEPAYVAFLAAFFLINETPLGWRVLAVITSVCMVASSVDTLQNGLAALISSEHLSSKRLTLRQAQLVTFLVNVPAVVLAAFQLSVLSLFLLADLLAAATIVPLGLGLWKRTHPTAALVGCVGGLATIIATFAAGGHLELGSAAAGIAQLYGNLNLTSFTLLTAFILAPAISGLLTVCLSLCMPYSFAGFEQTSTAPEAGVRVTKA